MKTLASVLTAKGAAAIAVVEVFGESAADVVRSFFRTANGTACPFDEGVIYTGDIYDGDELVDNVVVARTEKDSIEISCHGNPIIIEMIMEQIKNAGAELVDAETILIEKLRQAGGKNTIEIEAEVAKLKAVSVEGVRLIEQNDLSGQAAKWLSLPVDDVRDICEDVIKASRTARYLIHGCKAVLAGPPNSGKSTLLNCLAGKQKAIVTDIAGTTRDWVSVSIRIGGLAVEVFDTAGLDASLVPGSFVDAESQRRSMELLDKCDIVLLVLDSQKEINDFDFGILKDSGKEIVAVFNKCDIGGKEVGKKEIDVDAAVSISALTGDGIEELAGVVQRLLIDESEIGVTICFTDRQTEILGRLAGAEDVSKAKELINKLLYG